MILSGPPRTPSPPRKTPWALVGILASLGFVTAVGVVGWKLLSQLRQLQSAHRLMEQRAALGDQQFQDLQRQHAQLSQDREQLARERDDLLQQTKRAIQQRDEAEAVWSTLDQAFRQAESQRFAILERLGEMEQEREQLLHDQADLLGERAALQQELEDVRTRTQEKRLKASLSKEQREREALAKQLREATSLSRRLEAERGRVDKQLATLQGRVDTVERQHAKLLGDYRQLKKQSERVPGDVTKLAREHARLVKDLADTHYNMGVMFGKRRDYTRAATEFRRVIELRPEDAEAHYNLGVIYAEHLPDREKAMAFFKKYLNTNPAGGDASYAKQYIATWQAWEAKERLE